MESPENTPTNRSPKVADFEHWLKHPEAPAALSADFEARVHAQIATAAAPPAPSRLHPWLRGGIAASLVAALFLGLAIFNPEAGSTRDTAPAPSAWLDEEIILYAALFQGIDPDAFFEITELLDPSFNGT